MDGPGRPTDYSEELAADICAMMASGSSLRSICRSDSMPCESSVYLWLTKHPSFSENYAKAQKDRATAMFDDMLEIGDEVSEDPAAVAKARLRIDTRKWALARMDSKRFGDKVAQEISGPGGSPIPVTRIELVAPGQSDDNRSD